MSIPALSASVDDPILQELRERRIAASAAWDDIQQEAKKDRLCIAGNPWLALDEPGMNARKAAKRPYLALDELGQYVNQTVNQERANPRGIKFAPTGNGANDAGAEFYQNHTREIEYRSHAQMAYCTAFQNCVEASYGWLRIRTKREHVRTFNHDLWIDPIVNADQVLPDPNAIWPDSRDINYLFYIEPWTKREFERRFPDAKVKEFSNEVQGLAREWFQKDIIQVGEYWTIETYQRTLIAYQPKDGGPARMVLKDELQDEHLDAENVREEEVDDTRVKAWLTNGIELLEEIPWKGKYIPFVSCFGKVLYVEDSGGQRRKLLSLTRLMRDPYMLYCYLRTCEAEAVGATSRANWLGYRGQFWKGDEWAKSNKEPVEYLQALERTADTPPGQILPLPTKISWDPGLQNVELAAEAIRRGIQAAAGISPLPTPMQAQNQKSGVAMDKLGASQQIGSFHLHDHFDLMIDRTGVILEDLMDKYLDTARDVPTRLANDSSAIVRINDPAGSKMENGQLTGDPLFTKGDYRVTISSGPSSDSQRTVAEEFADTLATNVQTYAPVLGPQKTVALMAKAIKLKGLGPIGDELIEILDPPQKGPNGKPVSPEVQAAQQHIQQLTQQLQQLQQREQTEQVKWDNQKQIEQMKLTGADQKSQRDDQTKMAIAGLTERVDRMALLVEDRQHGRELVHQAREGVKSRLHDLSMARIKHTSDIAKQGHAQRAAKRMAETQGSVHAALARQQAQLQPPPSSEPTGAGA